jgi:hypothetical protein
MRKLFLSVVVALTSPACYAQTVVASFDSLVLPNSDTAYVNYFDPGQDVGFEDGGIHWPTVYDTTFGINFWDHGFSYSNKTDSTTSGFGNQYSAKTAGGYNGSGKYAVAYGPVNYLYYQPTGLPKSIAGFYITNSTYAYNSMRDGDAFGKKFGGATGLDSDWFKIIIRGILNGQTLPDTVEFYLADFQDPNSANDYIVNTWQWVSLTKLGDVDTLQLTLKSSDTSSFGLNTPAYFCVDNFTTNFTTSVNGVTPTVKAKIYPNPAADNLYVEVENNTFDHLRVLDMNGKLLATYNVNQKQTSIPTAQLCPGSYLLQLSKGNNKSTIRFLKQ